MIYKGQRQAGIKNVRPAIAVGALLENSLQ